jgi:hypothetical protein
LESKQLSEKKETVSRRNYMKYAGAGIVIVGAAAAGAYYGTMPKGPTETGTETTAETTKPGEKLRLDMVVWTWGIELIQDHVRMFN